MARNPTISLSKPGNPTITTSKVELPTISISNAENTAEDENIMKMDAIELTGEDAPRRMSGISGIEDLREDLTEFFDDTCNLGEGHGSLHRKPPMKLFSTFYFDLVSSLTENNHTCDWKALINATDKKLKRQKRLEEQKRREEEELEREQEEEDEDDDEEEGEEGKAKKHWRLLAKIVSKWNPIKFPKPVEDEDSASN